MSNQVPAFPPLTWDFPDGLRIRWIARLLEGRSNYRVISGNPPRLIVFPQSSAEVVEVNEMVKMVLSYQAVGGNSGGGMGGGRTKMPGRGRGKLILIILLIFILFLVVSCFAIRLFAFWFIENIVLWWA